MLARDESNRIADELFRCVKEGDVDAFDELAAPEFVLWHNTTQAEVSRADVFEHLKALSAIPDLAYSDIRRSFTDEGFISQHVVSGRKANGESFRLPVCLVVTVRNGKMVRANEWFDSAQDPRH